MFYVLEPAGDVLHPALEDGDRTGDGHLTCQPSRGVVTAPESAQAYLLGTASRIDVVDALEHPHLAYTTNRLSATDIGPMVSLAVGSEHHGLTRSHPDEPAARLDFDFGLRVRVVAHPRNVTYR